jgi:hypothetical protein
MAEADPRVSELQQLQREYRHMELNRRAYAEESQSVLRKQQQTVDKIRKDNEVIKSDIAMMMRGSTKPVSASQHDHIQKLQDQGDKYANANEFERQNISTMEEQIHIMKQKLMHQRKSMGGVNASKENHHMIQKQIRILENRLDKALMKFNEAISGNKTLRDQIDDLRRERVVFENIYRKMERELQDRKRQMAEIIEVSNQMYEQRDQFQMEVSAIEQSNRKEQEEFENQMVELGRMLDTELRLPSPSRQTQRSPGNTLEGDDMMSPDRRSLKSAGGFSQTGGGGGAEKQEVVNSYERVQNFEEAFNKIKAATGITDIDELVRTFIKNEDHNFSLFNYVNEQNNEVEKLEEQIQVLREEEKKYAQESGEDVHQHKQILKELEVKLQSTESMAEKYETRCQDLQRVIETLKRGVQSIFEKLGADEMGVSDPSVTESNMVHYLGQVEQKANSMINAYASVKAALNKGTIGTGSSGPAGSGAAAVAAAKAGTTLATSNASGLNDRDTMLLTAGAPNLGASKSQTAISVLGVGPRIPMGQELLHVNPPKLDDYQSEEDDDEDEDDARPLTRDELKARTMNRLAKRGNGAGGGGGNATGSGAKKGQGKGKKMNATR